MSLLLENTNGSGQWKVTCGSDGIDNMFHAIVVMPQFSQHCILLLKDISRCGISGVSAAFVEQPIIFITVACIDDSIRLRQGDERVKQISFALLLLLRLTFAFKTVAFRLLPLAFTNLKDNSVDNRDKSKTGYKHAQATKHFTIAT